MPSIIYVSSIMLPVLSGLGLYLFKGMAYRLRVSLALAVSVVVSLLAWLLILVGGEEAAEVIRFAPNLTILLRLDESGRFFTGIISALWPFTMLYACSYMKHEKHVRSFFSFFLMAYGASLGISMAGNLFTMYCFYELLTLTTAPLVMQPMTKEAWRATQLYLLLSLGGAAFAFAAMAFLLANGASGPFTMGGVLSGVSGSTTVARLFWLFGFLGFGVKAAIFPLHVWLPRASVAPTPVTALLHAVAVVKAGAFAVVRLTYYCFGTELLAGAWPQTTALIITAFTILFGSVLAVRETHFKRRLAYSTVSNLSYILFGAMLMTGAGLSAAFIHMAAHACIKITLFFCAGAVLHQTGLEKTTELDGLGKKLPVTFACFTVASLSLIGIPPFSGFISKWYLLTACADGGVLGWIGAAILLVSAFLTAVYLLTIVRRAWFPSKTPVSELSAVHEADAAMLVPICALALCSLLLGIVTSPIINAAQAVAAGM
ncbi:MAG: proton-conducting membrane transporter [Clostridia bacterium]|nr:proton-conducting membrane transporter [Clostridia bacterium]